MATKTRNTYISGTNRRNWPRAIATTTRPTPILQFLVVDRCRNHVANLSASSTSSKIRNLALEFWGYLSEFQKCNYFRFWGHIDTFGRRSLLYSFSNTIFHLYMVLNLRFVGILTVPCMVCVRFRPPFSIVGHYWNRLDLHLLHS